MKESKKQRLFNQTLGGEFLMLNKRLIEIFGLEFAGVLSNIIDKYNYFSKRNMDENGWFYFTEKQQCQQLGISPFSLRKTKKNIESMGFIQTQRKGIPAKVYFKINIDKIVEILEMDMSEEIVNKLVSLSLTCSVKFKELVSENVTNILYIRRTNKEELIKDKNKQKDFSSQTILPKQKIPKPSITGPQLLVLRNFYKYTSKKNANYYRDKKYQIETKTEKWINNGKKLFKILSPEQVQNIIDFLKSTKEGWVVKNTLHLLKKGPDILDAIERNKHSNQPKKKSFSKNRGIKALEHDTREKPETIYHSISE